MWMRTTSRNSPFTHKYYMHSSGLSEVSKAFTLVELMVVIFIIAILASILLPALSAVLHRGRKNACMSEIQQMKSAMTLYEEIYRDFPPSTLSEIGIKQSNDINNGIEVWVATLSGSYKDSSYFEFQEKQLANSDQDRASVPLNRVTQTIFNTTELFELIDPWANPYVYFHTRDLMETTKHSYMFQSGKKSVSPDMKRTQTGRVRGIGQYQIFSCGADEIPHNEDDILSE